MIEQEEGIGTLVDPDREVGVDPSQYNPFDPPIEPGNYKVMKAPGVVKREGEDAAGLPYVVVNLAIIEGPEEGKTIEAYFSPAPELFRKNATRADDLLHATEYQPYPRTAKAYALAMKECGGVFTIKTDLDAACFQHKTDSKDVQKLARIRSSKNIPRNEDGAFKEVVPCPVCQGEMVVRAAFSKIVMERR